MRFPFKVFITLKIVEDFQSSNRNYTMMPIAFGPNIIKYTRAAKVDIQLKINDDIDPFAEYSCKGDASCNKTLATLCKV